MKNTIIKSVKQLPEWFKLENYRKAEFFNAMEWYDELMPRFSMRQGLEKFAFDSIDLPQRWDLIKKDGLLFYSAKRQNICHRAISICPPLPALYKIAEENPRLDHEFVSLTSLQNFYVYASYFLIGIPERNKINQFLFDIFSDSGCKEAYEELKGESANWAGLPFDDFPSDLIIGLKNKFAYARVKLEASDEQIKKDFALWLDYERKKRNCPAPKKNLLTSNLIAGMNFLFYLIWI